MRPDTFVKILRELSTMKEAEGRVLVSRGHDCRDKQNDVCLLYFQLRFSTIFKARRERRKCSCFLVNRKLTALIMVSSVQY